MLCVCCLLHPSQQQGQGRGFSSVSLPFCVFISTRTVLHQWPMKHRSGTAHEHVRAVQLSSSQPVCFVQFARQFRRGTLVHDALGVVSVHCLRYCTSQHPSVTALLHAGRRVCEHVAEWSVLDLRVVGCLYLSGFVWFLVVRTWRMAMSALAAFSHCCCDAALADSLWILVQSRRIKCCTVHKGRVFPLSRRRQGVCAHNLLCVPPCW